MNCANLKSVNVVQQNVYCWSINPQNDKGKIKVWEATLWQLSASARLVLMLSIAPNGSNHVEHLNMKCHLKKVYAAFVQKIMMQVVSQKDWGPWLMLEMLIFIININITDLMGGLHFFKSVLNRTDMLVYIQRVIGCYMVAIIVSYWPWSIPFLIKIRCKLSRAMMFDDVHLGMWILF